MQNKKHSINIFYVIDENEEYSLNLKGLEG